jgi:hypothetical protein
MIMTDRLLDQTPAEDVSVPEVATETRFGALPTLVEELLAEFRAGEASAETSFELRSRGGYARSVTGTIALFDEEARTFMVRGHDGGLIRVPLREVVSTHPQ